MMRMLSVFPLCSRAFCSGIRRPVILGAGIMLLGLGWTGCASGGAYEYVKIISTGEKLRLPLEKGGPAPAKQGTISVLYAGFIPGPDPANKGLLYRFVLEEKNGVAFRSVRVDDVSDESAVLLVEDDQPKLDPTKQQWVGTSRVFKGDEPSLVWLTYVDDSMRVYRFTIVTGDGRTVVMYQGQMAPGWLKPRLRPLIGMP